MRDLLPILIIGGLLVAFAGKKQDPPADPPSGGGCIGCCPGTSTYNGMLRAKGSLALRYGSWAQVPLFLQIGHTVAYGQCPGYNDF